MISNLIATLRTPTIAGGGSNKPPKKGLPIPLNIPTDKVIAPLLTKEKQYSYYTKLRYLSLFVNKRNRKPTPRYYIYRSGTAIAITNTIAA